VSLLIAKRHPLARGIKRTVRRVSSAQPSGVGTGGNPPSIEVEVSLSEHFWGLFLACLAWMFTGEGKSRSCCCSEGHLCRRQNSQNVGCWRRWRECEWGWGCERCHWWRRWRWRCKVCETNSICFSIFHQLPDFRTLFVLLAVAVGPLAVAVYPLHDCSSPPPGSSTIAVSSLHDYRHISCVGASAARACVCDVFFFLRVRYWKRARGHSPTRF
jgi:hypothetical protein